MAVPVIAATGRIIAGSTKTTTRATATSRNVLERTAIRNQRDRRIQSALEEEQLAQEAAGLRAFQNQTRVKQLIAGSRALASAKQAEEDTSTQSLLRTSMRRVRAVAATTTTMGIYLWFYLAQLGCGMVFIVARYLEDETWTGWFIPGDTISMVGWAICSIISLVFMFIAIVSLVTVRAKIGKSLTMLVFIIGIAGSITPYFNLLPWPALFMLVAVVNQK